MKRDTFLPSLTTLLIFGMTLFLSCAHQNRSKDGLEAAADETVQEEVASTEEGSATPEGESANLTELTQDPSAESSPVQEEVAQAENTTQELDHSTLENLESDTQAVEQSTTPVESTAGVVSEQSPVTEIADAKNSELDPLTAAGAGATAGVITTEDSNNSTAGLDTPPPAPENTDVAAVTTPTEVPVQIEHMEPIFDDKPVKHSEGTHHARMASGSSSIPKIPFKPVTRGGDTLNRFYFVRSGDTPESVSQLIYGSTDHSSQLSHWNTGGWSAGHLVFFKSPTEPEEAKMRSFYQERNVQPEEYTIQRGDWLSRIAQKKLGAAGSWKEIAVVNGMNSPDSLEAGQKIAIYPRDLSSYQGHVAKEPVPEQPMEQPVAQAVPEQPQQPTVVEPPQAVEQVPPPAQQQPVEPPPVVQTPTAVDSNKVVEQNLPAVFILGAVLVLSALYIVVRRRQTKRKNVDEFADDSFAQPTKLKRK